MKLTIVPSDRMISVDGNGLVDIEQDFTWIPDGIHAVQWNEDSGEIEFTDNRPNEKITELGIFEQAVDCFNAEKARLIQAETEKLEAEEAARDYWFLFRTYRNGLLTECDWTQFVDSPLTEEQKQQWQIYRQQLRDLPDQIESPKEAMFNLGGPMWPTKPQ